MGHPFPIPCLIGGDRLGRRLFGGFPAEIEVAVGADFVEALVFGGMRGGGDIIGGGLGFVGDLSEGSDKVVERLD